MTLASPCIRCGNILHTGEGRVVVTFTVAELAALACATDDAAVRDRLLCALGLLDEAKEREVRAELWAVRR